jgi:3D (Asp-Asp-Asp) domain-containing protein
MKLLAIIGFTLALCVPAMAARKRQMVVTIYCLSCARCGTTGVTASGSRKCGVAVSRSSKIPLGSWLFIDGYGVRRANDYLPKGTAANRLDICHSGWRAHERGVKFGKQKRWVRVEKAGK